MIKNKKWILDRITNASQIHQQDSKVLYTFVTNKYEAYLLNIEPGNLVFLKTCNAEFDEVIITFTNQDSRPLK